MVKNIVVIGSNSEIAQEFVKLCKNNDYFVFQISSSRINKPDLYLENYEDKNIIIQYLKKIESPEIYFFNGYLAENRPKEFPNDTEKIRTFIANYYLPSEIAKLIDENINYNKMYFMSSLAAVKPRNKNYIYGLCKKMLEQEMLNVSENVSIFRFGQVKTKMSNGHSKPIMTLSKEEAAKLIFESKSNKNIIYPKFQLKVISFLIYLIPLKVLNKLELSSKMFFKNK